MDPFVRNGRTIIVGNTDLSGEGTDDTFCNGLAIAKCVTNGNYLLTQLQAGRIANCSNLEL